jgi:hypothetical protein
MGAKCRGSVDADHAACAVRAAHTGSHHGIYAIVFLDRAGRRTAYGRESGKVETAQVDALDERAVEEHIATVVKKAGTIDISFIAITPVPPPGTQGIPIAQLSVESFSKFAKRTLHSERSCKLQ